MKSKIFHLFLLYFILFAQIYSLHNFHLQILSNTGVVTPQSFCLLYTFDIFKVFGTLLFSNICDRKAIHKYLFSISALLQGIIMYVLYHLQTLCKESIRIYFVILFYILFVITQSGTVTILDSLSVNYLESERINLNTFGKIRVGGSLGNMFVNLLLFTIQKSIKKIKGEDYADSVKNSVIIHTFLIIGSVCCTFGCIFLPNYKKHIPEDKKTNENDETTREVQIEHESPHSTTGEKLTQKIEQKSHGNENDLDKKSQSWSFKKFFGDIKTIYSTELLVYTLSVFFYGIERASLGGYFTKYLELVEFERSRIYSFSLMRAFPEILIYLFLSKIEKFISIEKQFIISIISSSLRTFYYISIDFTANKSFLVQNSPFVVEFLKGISSALFNYSALRIFRKKATISTVSTAQGIFNAVYNALSYIFYAFLGYTLIVNEKSELTDSIKKLFTIGSAMSTIMVIVPFLMLLRRKKKNVIETAGWQKESCKLSQK